MSASIRSIKEVFTSLRPCSSAHIFPAHPLGRDFPEIILSLSNLTFFASSAVPSVDSSSIRIILRH